MKTRLFILFFALASLGHCLMTKNGRPLVAVLLHFEPNEFFDLQLAADFDKPFGKTENQLEAPCRDPFPPGSPAPGPELLYSSPDTDRHNQIRTAIVHQNTV